jgi:hypothetical protein
MVEFLFEFASFRSWKLRLFLISAARQMVQAIGTLTAEEGLRVMSEIPYFT